MDSIGAMAKTYSAIVKLKYIGQASKYKLLKLIKDSSHSQVTEEIFFTPSRDVPFIVQSNSTHLKLFSLDEKGNWIPAYCQVEVISSERLFLELTRWIARSLPYMISSYDIYSLRKAGCRAIHMYNESLMQIYNYHLNHSSLIKCEKQAGKLPHERFLSVYISCIKGLRLRPNNHITKRREPVLIHIVIPTYGKLHYTANCIASIARDRHHGQSRLTDNIEILIHIIDDAYKYTPEEEAILEELKNIDGILLHRNLENVGYLKACKQYCDSIMNSNAYLVLLNNDTEVIPGWLCGLLHTFERGDYVGVVGSMLLNPDYTLQEAGGIVWNDASAWNYGRNDNPDMLKYNYSREVDYVSAASLMMPLSLWKNSGGFDSRYSPAYYEDTDLCFRVRQMGLSVIYQPASRAIHYEGVTNSKEITQGIKSYQPINQIKFRHKWGHILDDVCPNGNNIQKILHQHYEGNLLVIESQLLNPQGDAGSYFMFNYLLAWRDLGYSITYVPANNFCKMDDLAFNMGARGIRVLAHPEACNIEDIFKNDSPRYDAILIARPQNWILCENIRKLSPESKVIYFTHDLHWLRTKRISENTKDQDLACLLMKESEELMLIERQIFKEADMVVHISEHEKEISSRMIAHKSSVYMPTEIVNNECCCDTKLGSQSIVFVGSFTHSPNCSGIQWFIENVWPLISSRNQEARLEIIGKSPPSSLTKYSSKSISFLGLVEDLSAIFSYSTVAICPVLEGAGLKGKILKYLSFGTPVVSSTLGLEGYVDRELLGQSCFIADTPQHFSECVLQILDFSSYQYLSCAISAREYVQKNYGARQTVNALKTMMKELDLPFKQDVALYQPYNEMNTDVLYNAHNSFAHYCNHLA